MEFQDVISTRRSIRAYKPDAVPEAAMARMKQAIQLAPTGSNGQPFKVVFIRNAALRAKIAGKACHQAFIAGAPVIAVVFCRKDHEFDAAIVTDHLVLAATAEGLGTCWVGWFERDAVKELVESPEGMSPCILVSIGYASEAPAPRPRKSLEVLIEVID
jgi:nitroreductase